MARLSILFLLIALNRISIAVPGNEFSARSKRVNSKMLSMASAPVENNIQEIKMGNKNFKVEKKRIEELEARANKFEELNSKVNTIFQKFEDLKLDHDRRLTRLENRSKRLLDILRSALKVKDLGSRDSSNSFKMVTEIPRRVANKPESITPYVIKRGGKLPVNFRRNIFKSQPINWDQNRDKRHEGVMTTDLSNDQNKMARTESQNLPIIVADVDASAATAASSSKIQETDGEQTYNVKRVTTKYTLYDLVKPIWSPVMSFWKSMGFN